MIEKQTLLIENEISKEQLTKELESVASEILERQEKEKLKTLTNPSAIALSTTKHETGSNINKVKRNTRELFILYLTNQFVARAINIRADTLVSRGYTISGKGKGVKMCEDLMDNSGGINLFWQLSVNTDIAGDGFLEKIYNKAKNKILRLKHVHPLTLEFETNPVTGKIVLNSNKEPKGYVQIFLDENGMEVSKEISKDKISHLRYNTLGDEFTGISTIQPGYDTIVRLMNMEYSAAEAAVKIANPIIVGTCNTKSPHQIAQWGQILGRISGREQVFVPQDMGLTMLSPGSQNFNEYAEYFLSAVVACFGVPKSILLGEGGGSGGGSNRAEQIVLSRHFYSLIRSNQRYVEDFFNKIFKEYGEIAGFEAPKLVFEDVAEDAEANSQSAIELFNADIIDRDEARTMIGLYPTKIKTPGTTLDKQLKDSDKKTFFPAEPGSKAGSQKNVKTKQKRNEFTDVK